jgi:hypothetical protein
MRWVAWSPEIASFFADKGGVDPLFMQKMVAPSSETACSTLQKFPWSIHKEISG